MARKSAVIEREPTTVEEATALALARVEAAEKPARAKAPKALTLRDWDIITDLLTKEHAAVIDLSETHSDPKTRSGLHEHAVDIGLTLEHVAAHEARAVTKAAKFAEHRKSGGNEGTRAIAKAERKAKRTELLAAKKKIKAEMKVEIMQRASEAIAEIDRQLHAAAVARKAKRA